MKLLTLLLTVLVGVAIGDSAASNVTLYTTSFEAPAFQTGLPLRGQDGWEMFHNGEAIAVATTGARSGGQCLRMDGSLLEQVAPNFAHAYCFSAILRDNPPAPPAIVEISAYARLDGPKTGTNGAAADDLMSANLLAIGDAGGQGVRLGGFLVSSAGKVFTVGSRGEDAYKFSAPMIFGAYHKLLLRVDFIARNVRYYVNDTYLGFANFAPAITADRLAGGYLEMAGPNEPFATPYVYDPTNYTAFFDDYSLVSVPLSSVNAIIEFASTNFLTDEFGLSARVNVVRRGFLNAALRVKVTTADDTARADEDYEATATFVYFSTGETNKVVEIPLLSDDYLAEPDKSFLVRLSELPPGATSGRPEARVFIRDDERPGSIDYAWSSNYGLPPLGSNEVKFAVPVIYPVPVQSDGKLLVSFDVEGPTTGVQDFRVVRLNTDGSVDATFPPVQSIRSLAAYSMPDGKILITEDNYPHGYSVLRRNLDGTPDSTFTARITNNWIAFKGLSDGKILAHGDSIGVNGQSPRNLVRLNADGSSDPTFTAPSSPAIYGGVIPLPNGKVLLAVNSGPSTGAGLRQLNSNGTLDASFNVGTGVQGGGIPFYPGINSVIVQADGKLVLGGYFKNFNGQVRNSIVRLNPNGSIDESFATGSGLTVRDDTGARVPASVILYSLPNERILVSEYFDQFNGESVRGPIIIRPDGSRDPSFEGAILATSAYVGDTTYVLAVVNGQPLYFRDYGMGRFRVDLPLRILLHQRDTNDTTHLTANALTGRNYTLQSSETLTNWTELTTNAATTNQIEFTDGPSSAFPKRFYRVKQN